VVKKKHVLFIIENQSVPYDVRVWSEAKAMKEAGYYVSVICPSNRRGRKRYEIVGGIEIFRHPMPVEADKKAGYLLEYSNAIFWEFLLSLKLLLKKPFHIIHAGNPPDHVFLLALFYKLFGIKYIFDHHDIMPETYFEKFGKRGLMHRALMLMEKLTFKTADIVISTNESYKKIAIERGNKKPEHVFVVRNGPDLSRVIFKSPNEKLKEGLKYLVAYLGVMNKQEGIDNLLQSVKHIVHTKGITNTKFVLIGTGSDWDRLVALSKEMGLERYVRFTGFIPYEELYEILATADVCVNPEMRNEFTDKSTMIKIMDYMVFGKPIVMYYTCEGKVTAGEAAVYIEKNDPVEFAEILLDLLADKEKRGRKGRIAKERIDQELKWDWQKKVLHKAYGHLENNC
jgi:glycosyltransferase involved in cell wall biosynthesis